MARGSRKKARLPASQGIFRTVGRTHTDKGQNASDINAFPYWVASTIKTGHFLSDEQGLKITDPRHEMGLWVFQVIESNLDYWELSVISGLKSRSTTLKFMRSSKLLNSRSNDLFCFSSRARFLLVVCRWTLMMGINFRIDLPFRTTAENRISNVRTLTKKRRTTSGGE